MGWLEQVQGRDTAPLGKWEWWYVAPNGHDGAYRAYRGRGTRSTQTRRPCVRVWARSPREAMRLAKLAFAVARCATAVYEV